MARLRYLGVIPARGGSKGIPRKNIKIIAGKPLIAWSIEAAKAAKRLDRFVVSTEDAEIAGISRRFGAEVLERPAELATDEATTVSALQHLLTKIDAENIVLLQPTSPVRDAGLIDLCVARFEDGGFDNLGTGFISKLLPYGAYHQRRQELEGFFHDDGSVYVVKAELILKGLLHGPKMGQFETCKDQNMEIDDDFDFWLNEQILLKRTSAST